jgi:hypothetical protein
VAISLSLSHQDCRVALRAPRNDGVGKAENLTHLFFYSHSLSLRENPLKLYRKEACLPLEAPLRKGFKMRSPLENSGKMPYTVGTQEAFKG